MKAQFLLAVALASASLVAAFPPEGPGFRGGKGKGIGFGGKKGGIGLGKKGGFGLGGKKGGFGLGGKKGGFGLGGKKGGFGFGGKKWKREEEDEDNEVAVADTEDLEDDDEIEVAGGKKIGNNQNHHAAKKNTNNNKAANAKNTHQATNANNLNKQNTKANEANKKNFANNQLNKSNKNTKNDFNSKNAQAQNNANTANKKSGNNNFQNDFGLGGWGGKGGFGKGKGKWRRDVEDADDEDIEVAGGKKLANNFNTGAKQFNNNNDKATNFQNANSATNANTVNAKNTKANDANTKNVANNQLNKSNKNTKNANNAKNTKATNNANAGTKKGTQNDNWFGGLGGWGTISQVRSWPGTCTSNCTNSAEGAAKSILTKCTTDPLPDLALTTFSSAVPDTTGKGKPFYFVSRYDTDCNLLWHNLGLADGETCVTDGDEDSMTLKAYSSNATFGARFFLGKECRVLNDTGILRERNPPGVQMSCTGSSTQNWRYYMLNVTVEDGGKGGGSNVGAIAGGVVGGVVVLAIAGVAIWWFRKKGKEMDQGQLPQVGQSAYPQGGYPQQAQPLMYAPPPGQPYAQTDKPTGFYSPPSTASPVSAPHISSQPAGPVVADIPEFHVK
ncbi:hypothetical protein HK097_001234 [Rhizophlyctis rosea]|uniref:Uncharacterized protein n=1 Tax=Rhizophlyctis rosea TaxID=64517 RepID=A0AAD5S745_9FUNG|nr:hypothetical protein HK097_001234 [Rhizophlyctis rosea]